MLNSDSDIAALHKKYAPSDVVYDLVFTHCSIVRDICVQLIDAKALGVNRNLVEVGALLHDVGVYSVLDAAGKLRAGVNYITHGIEGERILHEEGLPENICRFAAHHTGVGLTKQDVIDQKHPLPLIDYLADTDEELLIMYADKFHAKTTPPCFNSYEWYRQDVLRFGADKATRLDAMAAKFGKPDLKLLQAKYQFEIR